MNIVEKVKNIKNAFVNCLYYEVYTDFPPCPTPWLVPMLLEVTKVLMSALTPCSLIIRDSEGCSYIGKKFCRCFSEDTGGTN